MKISIEHHKTKISIDVPESGLNKAVEAVAKIYDRIAGADAQPEPIIENATAQYKPLQPEKEAFEIRERLPNSVVDINELTVKQAVTENALVRCPHCGQAHALVVKDTNLFLMRKNYDKNEFEVVAIIHPNDIEDIMCREGKYTEYFEDLQKTAEVSDIKNFAVSNDTEIFCPVCHKASTFMKWKDAWENPLHFFETDSLCEVCGNEVSISVEKDGHKDGICNECKTEVVDGKPVLKQQSTL